MILTSCRIDSLSDGALNDYQIIINTTPVGMFPDIGSSPIDPSLLGAGMTVFDIVYAPARTRLLDSVESAGSRDNPKRDYYLWRDPAPGDGPPETRLPFVVATSGGPPPSDAAFVQVRTARSGSEVRVVDVAGNASAWTAALAAAPSPPR